MSTPKQQKLRRRILKRKNGTSKPSAKKGKSEEKATQKSTTKVAEADNKITEKKRNATPKSSAKKGKLGEKATAKSITPIWYS